MGGTRQGRDKELNLKQSPALGSARPRETITGQSVAQTTASPRPLIIAHDLSEEASHHWLGRTQQHHDSF